MAPPHGRASADLIEALRQEPYRFGFFQAVRLLERLSGRAPVGMDAAPDLEAVRFRAMPGLSFPPSEIGRLGPTGGAGPLDMVVSFLGLTGPSGVLPQHYTALLLARIRSKDYSLRDFLDLFNHRLIALFYRAWEKYRLPFAFERFHLGSQRADTDPVTSCVYCLAGMGTEGLRGRQAIPDAAFLYYAGHFAHQPRSALGLEGVLQDYFGLAIRVVQAYPQWLSLQAADQSFLPDDDHPDGRNAGLGVDLIVGEDLLDVQSKFRVQIGALRYEDFRRFFPGSPGLGALAELTRSYVGPEFDFDVQVLLFPKEVPWCRLAEEELSWPQLGWNTWLRNGDLERVVDDAVFESAAP